MKITANTHASFSLPVVLREPIIINMGNNHINAAAAKSINMLGNEWSILHRFLDLSDF